MSLLPEFLTQNQVVHTRVELSISTPQSLLRPHSCSPIAFSATDFPVNYSSPSSLHFIRLSHPKGLHLPLSQSCCHTADLLDASCSQIKLSLKVSHILSSLRSLINCSCSDTLSAHFCKSTLLYASPACSYWLPALTTAEVSPTLKQRQQPSGQQM